MVKSRKIRVFTRFKKKKNEEEKVEIEMETQQRQPLKTVEDLHQEVDEVTQVMHQNLVKIRDREGKLDTLVDKSERLEEGTNQFAVVTSKARKETLAACASETFDYDWSFDIFTFNTIGNCYHNHLMEKWYNIC
uniref:V-SNARE coiled-coil homology domain-containing protein n=2 Tax=Magallana gigas TaxID=29159 RepID=A0A8W8LHT7_MAGGI|nr:uncharacterized protein LOC105329809 [Crassostrea gigas]